jgi:ABC-2 type transport system ATP-binding protein
MTNLTKRSLKMSNIIINNLGKNYGKKKILDDISLSIEPGLFGLLGPNGAGKTTFMKILCTLTPFDNGDINVYSLDLKKDSQDVRAILGYLPQQFDVPLQLTGEELLYYVASLKGISRELQDFEVQRVLKEVNLEDKSKNKIKEYSGGMKRRLGIAQAIIGKPKILVVDEPTAGLDPSERIRFRNLIEKLSREMTIIISTHILSDIETSCRDVAVLNKGIIKHKGSVHSLAQLAQNIIWEISVPIEQFDYIEENFLVTSSKSVDRQVIFRVLQKEPPKIGNPKQVQPTVEDGYMAILNGVVMKNGKNNSNTYL